MACLLTRLFNGNVDPAEVFTPDYQQVTDGHMLDYQGFMKHLNHVRAQIREITFTVEALCCHNECVADRHRVAVTYPDGRRRIRGVYVCHAARGKICRIHEVTQAPDDDAFDRTLAHAMQ